ncbi:MAG TPA: hypothetical protein VJY84_02265, partial [Candidatus Saccharimonadales bacterium]|nr:hypothetical protein [Candidatus Saccharimonadales bacterium]
KAGQNVRLAGKLTGHELDVEAEKGKVKAEEAKTEKEQEPAKEEKIEAKPVVQKLKRKSDLEDSLLKAIEEHGTDTDTDKPSKSAR